MKKDHMETHQIERLIRSLGIGATYRGYRYLSYAITLCLDDENYLLAISKVLYPEIAKTFRTTSCSVERDIRTIIKICWDRGNRQLLQDIALHPLTSRPTSGEFLDIIVAHLHRNSQKP